MKRSRRWRQKILNEIWATPVEDLAKIILAYRRFRKKFLLEAYLDRCDDLASESPLEGLKLVEPAPEYARLTKYAEGTLEDDRAEMRAWMIIGSAYRALGDYIEAEEAYKTAATFRATADDQACLRFRMAVLRTEQGDHCAAYELADAAVAHFERRGRNSKDRKFPETDHCSLATALVIRGVVQVQGHAQGVDIDTKMPAADFLLALRCSTDTTPKARRSALQNLLGMAALSWISEEDFGLKPAEIDLLMAGIVRRLKRSHGPKSISLAKAFWIQGSARARLASSTMVPRARYLFRDALRIFTARGNWENVVHISLEMAWWCLQGNDIAGAIEVIEPLLTPECAQKYPRHWLSILETLKTSGSLQAAADAIQKIRGIKVTIPDPKPVVARGRWVSDVGW